MSAAAGPPSSSQPALLVARHLDKSFPGVTALADVGIEVFPGEVVGLVGENGAGKSTLMRILAGVYQPDRGEILLEGKALRIRSPAEAAAHGIGMVFQEQSLLPNLTVGENIYLGHEARFTRAGFVRWPALYAAARRQLEKVGLDLDPASPVADLDFATRQMVELAKAMRLEDESDAHLVILLDEPTSVLERAEIEVLFARMRALRSRASFVFVSHRLDEVLAVSDRVYVMKDGGVVATLKSAEADTHELHRLMVGRGRQAEYYRETDQKPYRDEVSLSVQGLASAGQFREVSFDLHAGEVLGIAGVIGSGREALCRVLFGFEAPSAGTMRIADRAVRLSSPADAVRHGVGYIPRERRTEGLVLFLSVATNATLASLKALRRRGMIDYGAERRLVTGWVDRLRIRTPGIRTLCLNLSGGNQQKVVLAKWLTARSKILVLDHPTRGLDVGAKEEVYELIRAVTAEGIAVVLTSDTLEETIGLSHTILVMRDGVVTRRFDAAPGRKPEQVQLIEHMV
jgi:ribose transport system ATP-binding protein